jgi:superfamily II DNA or RNA helicase
MEMHITNKIRLINIPEMFKNVIVDKLRIDNPTYTEALIHGYSVHGLNPHIYNFSILPDDSILVPRGFRETLFDLSNTMNIPITVSDNRTYFAPDFSIDSTVIKYRPYQSRAISELILKEEGMLVAPPGSGKTVMGLSLIPLYGQPTLWITHTDRLAKQTRERVHTFLPSLKKDDIGYIGAGKWKVGKILTIAMVQTLYRRLEELLQYQNNFGLVIVDEAHHCPATTFTQVVCQVNPFYLYGLTATPYRRDKLESLMFQTIGDLRVRVTMEEVEADGGIVIPTVKYRAVQSKRVDGTNVQSILKNHIVNNDKRNGLIVGDVLREAINNNYCLVVSDRKAHCEILYELISLHWEKTGIATGDYSKKYIDEQVEKFYNNEITVLVTTSSLLGEGFDVDFLNRAFLAMPVRAEGKIEQIIGRIQRTAPGKKDAILYDYVDVNIGVLQSQFHTRVNNKDCRYKCYERLGVHIEPY